MLGGDLLSKEALKLVNNAMKEAANCKITITPRYHPRLNSSILVTSNPRFSILLAELKATFQRKLFLTITVLLFKSIDVKADYCTESFVQL